MSAAGLTHTPAGVRVAVAESLASLPSRYRVDRAPASRRRYLLRIGDAPPAVVVAGPRHCRLAPSVPDRVDAEVWIDADAWLALDAGQTTGPQAFLDGRVSLRGDLNEALRLETLFAHPDNVSSPRLWRHEHDGAEIAVHEAGPPDGPPVLAVHGLGASKVSLLPVVAGLAGAGHRVLALDLPGFGASDPVDDARYTQHAFAEAVLATLDAAGIDRAMLVGNSLGGRVVVELALAEPDRVAGLGLLCPAVAFEEYALVRPVLRALPAHRAMGWARWPRLAPMVDRALARMFADPARVPADNLVAAREDFVAAMGHGPRRRAMAATMRQLALERPGGFWPKLGGLRVPSLWIFGEADRLVHPGYADRVRAHAPGADVQRWADCGHVPQFEHPEAAVAALTRLAARAR